MPLAARSAQPIEASVMIRLTPRAQRLHWTLQPRQSWTCCALSACSRDAITTFRISWSLKTLHEQTIIRLRPLAVRGKALCQTSMSASMRHPS